MNRNKAIVGIISIALLVVIFAGVFYYRKSNNITNNKITNDIKKDEEQNILSPQDSEKNLEQEKVKENIDNPPSVNNKLEVTEPNINNPKNNNIANNIDPNKIKEKTNIQDIPEKIKEKASTVKENIQSKAGVNPGEIVPKSENIENKNNGDGYIGEVEQLIFQKVNEERKKASVAPLTYNKTMEKYARIKSKDMSDRKYFDHKDPDGKYIKDQMIKDGVSFSAWAENIAYITGEKDNATVANQFMNNWMNSQGHRANILSSEYQSIGVGVYKIGNTYYATQEFYK
ncbi:CAP domain-containing protein [Clostridium fallax]|uniref:Cysteine-rich secretory protein family protein n=1 Tax=Clostridium fallax TaxID=1533 RepID=A0A1M4XQ91_9CLOT|nr:CAP domain-containing protein [Clostridium fallax]SHE95764.1 Cysteine-rich secretory protein family protein [Clostridium fallax]SQB08080.1 SCP-like extracellular protein [Clostridium fallax]